MIEVKQITEYNQNIVDTIVEWMNQWWGIDEGYSLEEVQSYVQHSFAFGQGKLPQTYGLFVNQKFIGMYQLTYHDLDIRPDIYPWIANVYIDEKFRHQGYSQYLLQTIDENVKNNDFQEVYLYTHHQGLYEKYGFQLIEEIDTYNKVPRIQRLYKRTI